VQLKGLNTGEGDVEVESTISGEADENAQRSYQEKYVEYQKLSEAVLESEPIPLGHRQSIRRYFEAIRPRATDK